MSLTDSEDSDESESNDCVIIEEFKPKAKPQPKSSAKPSNLKPTKSDPNVMQFEPHFIPGKAFENNNVVKSHSFVRKRNNNLRDHRLSSQQSIEENDGNDSDQTIIDEDYSPEDWRNGPAKRWYDMLGLSPNCQQYDYGFKLKTSPDLSVSPPKGPIDSEDSFNLVSQISWEKNVIWDSDAVRQKVMKNVEKPSIAGWIPVEEKRTAPDFFKQVDDSMIEKLIVNDVIPKEVITKCNESTKCDKNKKTKKDFSNNLRKRKAKFCDNDSENTSKKSIEVTNIRDVFKWVSTLHEENRELIGNRWEDDIIWDPTAMTRIPEPKIIPFSSNDDNAIIEWNEIEDNSNDSNHNTIALKQLSLNISNDEFYASVTKADNSATHTLLITHSNPAIILHPLCFPSWDSDFFRPILKRSRNLMPRVEHNVLLYNKQNTCLLSETQNSEDLSKYLIKNVGELTALTGKLILMEYSEENPPLIMRIGMGSQLLNYFNKTKNKNYCPEQHRFAQTKAVTTSPFIGELGANRSQLAIENNMFRSPIWEHILPDSDFLIIRTDDNYYIRDIDSLFVVGQTLPLMEAPRLKSKGYYNFAKQFAKMFIYRLFNQRKFVTNLYTEMRKAFPYFSKHFIELCINKYTERRNDRFVLKSEIPFDNQINDLLTPENYCAFYSSVITAATTLKEIGFGDRLHLDKDENNCDNKVEELFFAPWNTTTAYIKSLNAKKYLNVNDYNEDGSIIFKNQSYKEFQEQMPSMKKCQPLSNLSIKRLTLKKAHEWLIGYGMSKDKVKRYKNVVECQELIKDLSDSMRENGITEKMNKTEAVGQYYKLQCQKVFDLHSRFYSKKVYESDSSDLEEDEEQEDDSDSDLEKWGQDLEAMLLENKSFEDIEYEREEKERKEWLKTLKGQKDPKEDQTKTKRSFKGKALRITRTFESKGKKYVRDEIVRDKRVIEAYVRIRENKSEEFIRQLSLVKNHKESGVNNKSKPKNKSINSMTKPSETSKNVNGVLKTVSENLSNIRNGFVSNANDIEEIDINEDNWDINSDVEENESLVRVDGSKLKFSKKVVNDAKKIEAEQQKRIQQELEEEERSKTILYYTPRSSRRVRIDPMVKLRDIFDRVIIEVRKREELDENIEWFLEPIRPKDVPDYYDVIKNPIDLKTIRNKISCNKYPSREEFLKDVKLIYENSLEYNGDNEITADAYKLFQFCKEKLDSMEDCIVPLEQMKKSETTNG